MVHNQSFLNQRVGLKNFSCVIRPLQLGARKCALTNVYSVPKKNSPVVGMSSQPLSIDGGFYSGGSEAFPRCRSHRICTGQAREWMVASTAGAAWNDSGGFDSGAARNELQVSGNLSCGSIVAMVGRFCSLADEFIFGVTPAVSVSQPIQCLHS